MRRWRNFESNSVTFCYVGIYLNVFGFFWLSSWTLNRHHSFKNGFLWMRSCSRRVACSRPLGSPFPHGDDITSIRRQRGASSEQRYIIACCYVTWDEQLSDWGRVVREGWKGRVAIRRMGKGGKRDEGARPANESGAKPPLVWQLRACTVLLARPLAHILTVLAIWVWSLRSGDSPKVTLLFRSWKGLRVWKCDCAAAGQYVQF